MATATQHSASSASASSARADGTSAVTATEHDEDVRKADLYYEVMLFLKDALVDVCKSSSPPRLLQSKCIQIVYEFFDEWGERGARKHYAFYNEPALLKHKEIVHMLKYDKWGNPRENCFLTWCKRVYAIREAHGTTTEHTEASDDQEKQWYKILGEGMRRHELLPRQMNDPTYQIHYNREGDVVLSSKQRNWIQNMLRKHLGDKNVAFFHIPAWPS